MKTPPLRFRLDIARALLPLCKTEGDFATSHGPWERKRLDEFVSFKKGKGYSKADLAESGTPIFLYGRMYTDYRFEVDTVDTFAALKKGSVLSSGSEVVIPASGETAEDIARASAVKPKGIILGGDLNVLTPLDQEEIETTTLALALSNGSASAEIAARAQGKTVVHIHNGDLKDIPISIPSAKAEQQKIGAFFRSLDELIAARERAVEKTEALKKSMLQKMFPQGDAAVPEVRFRGFGGEWERKRLGAIGFTYNGLSGKNKSDFGHGLGRYVPYMNVFSNPIADSDQCDTIEIDGSQNEVKDGDVFFTTSSETPEEVGMSSVWIGDGKNTYLNSFCFGYRPKPGNVSDFLAYMFRANAFRRAISFLAQGISRYNISKAKVMEINVLLPCVDEQRKIGECFRSIDTLIAARQEEVRKLRELKNAFLERMFV